MIFGIIYWMFPIITRARPRGNETLAWVCYGLLNAGLLLRIIAEPLTSTRLAQQFHHTDRDFRKGLVPQAVDEEDHARLFVHKDCIL